jgi:hypothetical protein
MPDVLEPGNSSPSRVTKPSSVRLLVPLPGMSLSSVELAGTTTFIIIPLGENELRDKITGLLESS